MTVATGFFHRLETGKKQEGGSGRSWWSDLLFSMLLAMAAVKFTHGMERIVDVHMFDETNYLIRGIQLREGKVPPPDWAPLYSAWYSLLSLVQPERLALYFLNWKLLTGLTSLTLYALVRGWCSPAVSFIASWAFMTSSVNWDVWARPAHFALVVVLLTLSVAERQRSAFRCLMAASTGALVASYARPELFLTFLLSMVVVAAMAVSRMRKGRRIRVAVPLMACVLLVVVVLRALGAPAFTSATPRSNVAFGQHFSYNYWRWNDRPAFDPWADWVRVVTEHFGGQVGVIEAFRRNPAMAWRHTHSNLTRLAPTVAGLCVKRPNHMLPEDPSLHAIERVFWGLLFVGALAARLRSRTRAGPMPARRSAALLACTLFAIPGLVSAVVIYPKDYYLLFPLVLGVVGLLAWGFPRGGGSGLGLQAKCALTYGVIAVVLTPCMKDWPQPKGGVPNVETIEFLKSLKLEGQIHVLEAEGGLPAYVGGNFHRVNPYAKEEGFFAFLDRYSAEVILISDTLLRNPRFRHDPEWLSFLADPGSFRFVKKPVPHTDRLVLIANELLPEGST